MTDNNQVAIEHVYYDGTTRNQTFFGHTSIETMNRLITLMQSTHTSSKTCLRDFTIKHIHAVPFKNWQVCRPHTLVISSLYLNNKSRGKCTGQYIEPNQCLTNIMRGNCKCELGRRVGEIIWPAAYAYQNQKVK